MKSYALAVALAMLLAATYAFQNTGEILVRFLIWERTIPQGIWDVLLFAAGGVLMWFVSLFALLETRGKYVRQVREKDKRIKELEEERTSLMNAFRTQQEPEGLVKEQPVSGPPTEEVFSEPVKPVDDSSREEGDEGKTDQPADLNERRHPSGEDNPDDEPGEALPEEEEDETKGV
jgi:uncharacterized integral membrane protein